VDNYWSRVAGRRLTRRRALAATGATGLAAMLLAACGDDDAPSSTGSTGGTTGGSTGAATGATGGSTGATGSTGGSTGATGGTGTSSLIFQPVDTSAQAKRGGVMKWYSPNEPAHFDTNTGLSPLNTPNNLTTSLLVMEKPGIIGPPEYSEVLPDLAESWEWSPDGLQLTMKLRSGVKWHNKAPVNGRAFEVDDILASWSRFESKAQGRANLANSVNPNAPVLKVEATDASTIVFTLKDPVVYFLSMLTPNQTGSFQMLPKEADNGFDPRQDLIGTGPFILTDYRASQGMTFQRNPDYWDAANTPFFDTIEYPIITEYAQQLAQIKAGNIYSLFGVSGSGMRPDDILVTRKDVPELNLYAVKPWGFSPGVALQFGTQPTEANAAFKDERVRQAFSMAHDREAYIDVFSNVSKFVSEGLPVETHWFTSLGAAPGWRIDPRDAAFGENAKYFQHNIEEAKKLLAAAGYPDGMDVIANYIQGAELNTAGRPYHQQIEVRLQMLNDIGVRGTPNLIDYTTQYVPQYITKAGAFDGILFRVGVAASNDPVVWTEWRYKSKSGDGWIGFDAAGVGDASGDPEVDSIITKARSERDVESRKSLLGDLQRYLAQKMYLISEPGVSDTFDLTWPAVGNHRVFNGDRRTHAATWWLDDTKQPLA
jgi:peptide/nickel transport system substrate-binding protein